MDTDIWPPKPWHASHLWRVQTESQHRVKELHLFNLCESYPLADVIPRLPKTDHELRAFLVSRVREKRSELCCDITQLVGFFMS